MKKTNLFKCLIKGQISKKVLFFIFITLSLGVFSQNEDYIKTMIDNIKIFNMARSLDNFQSSANTFERISNAEIDQWQPLYYAAFSYINMSFIERENEKKDQYMDKAQTYLDKAFVIYPDESELFALQGLLYQGRIQIDPVSRGMKYSQKAGNALEKAKEYNPDNPRAYYLSGQNVLHTPEMFGGGAKAACPLFQTAKTKFEKFIPMNVVSPNWGEKENLDLIKNNCKEK